MVIPRCQAVEKSQFILGTSFADGGAIFSVLDEVLKPDIPTFITLDAFRFRSCFNKESALNKAVDFFGVVDYSKTTWSMPLWYRCSVDAGRISLQKLQF